MSRLIPERDFSCASTLVPLEDCPVLCFFVCVRFALASSAPAPLLRFMDPFFLFRVSPAELKYEFIGSSPDMDGRGPMKVHTIVLRAAYRGYQFQGATRDAFVDKFQ
jgi:hypothetical protein